MHNQDRTHPNIRSVHFAVLRQLRMFVAVPYAECAYLALLFRRELRRLGVYLRAFVLVVGLEMVELVFASASS